MPCRPVAVAAAACLIATGAAAQERFQITGSTVAVYNIAGQITLEPGTGSAVVIEVTRGGPNAGELTIERGPIAGRETLRVIYPSDVLRYPEASYRGASDLWVREDGTFGDSRGERRRGPALGRQRPRQSPPRRRECRRDHYQDRGLPLR